MGLHKVGEVLVGQNMNVLLVHGVVSLVLHLVVKVVLLVFSVVVLVGERGPCAKQEDRAREVYRLPGVGHGLGVRS